MQPGIYVIRWDLSNFTNDFRVTEANQGDDDALDSDGVSGDVGEFVYTAEIAFPGGTPNLNVDLGLVETLPAIQAAAKGDLTAALVNHLLDSAYTAENWTALKAAKANGDLAIDTATAPAGVTAAKDSALTEMHAVDAVATYVETLIFTDVSRTSEGEVTLVLRTTPYFPLTLQTSTDLKSWTSIATVSPVTELWTFVHDAALANSPKRFYRAFHNP